MYETRRSIYNLFKIINVICITIYFIWYITPIFRAYFYGGIFNALIICLIAIWLITAIVLNPNWVFQFNFHIVIVSVQLLVFVIMALLFPNANAISYMKLGLSFWFTLYVYHFYITLGWRKVIGKIGLVTLTSLVISTITTLIGLISLPNAARSLTSSSTLEQVDKMLQLKNIGGFDLIYGLIILIPGLMGFIFLEKKEYGNKHLKKIVLAFIFLIILVIINASFTIGILILIFSIIIGFFSKLKSRNLLLIGLILSFLIPLIPTDTVGIYVKQISYGIDNPYVSERFEDIGNFLQGTTNSSQHLLNRTKLYEMSLNTFKENPMGIGSYYYVNGVGIGYHSQILDDLARYGILGLLFYLLFFYTYYRYIQKQWNKSNFNVNFLGTLLTFLFISSLNPTFSSQSISIIIFFVVPALPEIIKYRMGILNNRE